jgi:hypothetical protein
MQKRPVRLVNLLSAPKWLELAAEVRELADTAQSPEVSSALRELALSYTAMAAGLDAPNGPHRYPRSDQRPGGRHAA